MQNGTNVQYHEQWPRGIWYCGAKRLAVGTLNTDVATARALFMRWTAGVLRSLVTAAGRTGHAIKAARLENRRRAHREGK